MLSRMIALPNQARFVDWYTSQAGRLGIIQCCEKDLCGQIGAALASNQKDKVLPLVHGLLVTLPEWEYHLWSAHVTFFKRDAPVTEEILSRIVLQQFGRIHGIIHYSKLGDLAEHTARLALAWSLLVYGEEA